MESNIAYVAAGGFITLICIIFHKLFIASVSSSSSPSDTFSRTYNFGAKINRPLSKIAPIGGSLWKRWLGYGLVALGRKKGVEIELCNLDMHEKRMLRPDLDEHYNDSFVFIAFTPNGDLFISRLGFRNCGRVDCWVRFFGGEQIDIDLFLHLFFVSLSIYLCM